MSDEKPNPFNIIQHRGMTKAEIAKIAAKWWKDEITKASIPQSGDISINAMTLRARNLITPPAEEQLLRFQDNLEMGILNDLESRDTGWSEANPKIGSALRGLRVDYDPCRILKEAAEDAGISDLFFPIKTFMRLNPDGVEVSCGYEAPIEKIVE